MILLTLALLATTAAADGLPSSGSVGVTPHASYSSSVGVLGCKINTNRIAYWPYSVDCNNICVSLSYGGRTQTLLRIDQSGGAYDVSYDAWNYLYTGYYATQKPTTGGAITMTYEVVSPSKCADIINTSHHKLPLSASNSIDFLVSCLDQEDSWVADNYVLYNIQDPLCSYGVDETCTLNLTASNQPTCKNTLGIDTALTTDPVYNIEYGTGEKVLATNNAEAAATATPEPDSSAVKYGARLSRAQLFIMIMSLSAFMMH
ncbi:hypothetical protein F5Y16DRAFT_358612 [Xylariaceae sp. FL0255]|nr:hypothetical protein F5Y16DRAFT_358612 [Xylariaceae sp. FL0255]